MGTATKVRVILADDHAILRQCIRTALERRPDIQVVGDCDNGDLAVHKAKELQPDLAILDVTMPGTNGIEAARRIRQESPGTVIIALSMFAQKPYIVEMFKAGASGYVLKEYGATELLAAVDAVMSGQRYISPHAQDVLDDGDI